MTLNELDFEIEAKKSTSYDNENKENYLYIKELTDENNMENIVDFLNLDIWKFIKCNLYINFKDKSMDECSKITDFCKNIFEDLEESKKNNILGSLLIIKDNGKIDEVIECFENDKDITIIKYIGINPYITSVLMQLKKCANKNNIDIVPFLKGFEENSNLIISLINLYYCQKEINELKSHIIIAVDGKNLNEKQLENIKIEALTSFLKNKYDIDKILSKVNQIKEYTLSIEKKQRRNFKEISSIEFSRELLKSALEKKEILNYREIIKGIKDPKIKYCMLTIIKEHNEDYYKELNDEIKNLQESGKTIIEALFNEYGISNNYYDVDEISNIGIKELKTILKTISILEISADDKVNVIKSASLDNVKLVKEYLDRNILTISFVSNHLELFNKDSIELEYLIENLGLIKKYNVPLDIFVNSLEILINNPKIINKNLQVLEGYDLLKNIKLTNNYEFLVDNNLEVKIDKFLELGYGKYLEKDLSLLNKKEIERLEILKLIGIPIESKERLNEILDDNKQFFIDISDMNNYLYNACDYAEEPNISISIDELECYKVSNLLYDFDGLKVSYNKVQRMIENGNSIYQSIIYNMLLSEEELIIIQNILNNVNDKKNKQYVKNIVNS